MPSLCNCAFSGVGCTRSLRGSGCVVLGGDVSVALAVPLTSPPLRGRGAFQMPPPTGRPMGCPLGRATKHLYNRLSSRTQVGTRMCGIIGFINKRWDEERPAGAALLAMLRALSCRGPDSAGVALYGPPQPFWVVQVKLPESVGAAV